MVMVRLLKIGVDLDNTLVDLNTPVFERINKEFGTDYKNDEIRDWGLSTFPENIRKRIFDCYNDPTIMGQLKPFPWSKHKIRQMKNSGHTVILITARNIDLTYPTVSLVRRHFENNIDKVIVVDGSKARHFQECELDVWIDDGPSGVQDAVNLGIRTIMISNNETKYNYHMRDVPGVEIVESIGHVVI